MTGAELKEWRRSYKKSQLWLADFFGVSQKTISNWQNKGGPPSEVKERLNAFAEAGGQISTSHSWPVNVFVNLRELAPKSAREVLVRAVISPTYSGASMVADYAAELRFSGLKLRGQRLYNDHIRHTGAALTNIDEHEGNAELMLGGSPLIPESMITVQIGGINTQQEVIIRQGDGALYVGSRDGKYHHVLQTGEVGVVRARLDEDQRMHLPQNLAYEVYDADPDEAVSIYLHAEQGFHLNTMDAIGYAYYTEADFLVEQISLEVEFRDGLVPFPDPPNARAQLIRRTSVRPNSLSPDFPKPIKVKSPNSNSVVYRFGPLLRPKGGFLYSLVWAKLVKAI